MDTLHDLAQTTGGRILPASRIPDGRAVGLGRIVTDSRQVQPGDVFWALQGTNHEGDCFVNEAFRHGAQGAIVSRIEAVPEDCWTLLVDDTQRALDAMGAVEAAPIHRHRDRRDRQRGQDDDAANDPYGAARPLPGHCQPAKLQQPLGRAVEHVGHRAATRLCRLELGANRPGEIAALADLSAPKVGVITQLGDAHLGGFGSRQGVAEAKTELLAALPASGHAVLADDSWLRALASRLRSADHLDRQRAAVRPPRGRRRDGKRPAGVSRPLRP